MALVISPAWAKYADPADFIQSLGDRAISVLENSAEMPREERAERFRDLLIESFDLKTIGRFVIGRHWRRASKEQQSEYTKLFVDFVVSVYATRFGSYSGETIEVIQLVEAPDGDSIVRTRINRPAGGEPIKLDYRVRSVGDTYKVIDVVVEGISMLNTHRSEFSSVINRKGMDGFLAELRARIDEANNASSIE